MHETMKLSFPGYLYPPSGEGPFPAMLLLHGSEGGNGDYWTEPGAESLLTGEAALVPMYARHFASSGFLAYAHSYFGSPGTPQELANIDLQNTIKAFEWLRNSPSTHDRKIVLWGGSRGAELALILAAKLSELGNPGPNLIIARSPSDFVYPGLER